MRSRYVVAIVFLVVHLLGCSQQIDVDAETALLRQTDLDWAAAAIEATDVDRIVGFWSDDAKVYPPGVPVIEGKDAIREFVAGGLSTPGFSVSWEPEEVIVFQDGRSGYSTGLNSFTAPGPDGDLVTTVGRYVTIWRKRPDGSWECVIDIWNTGPTS